MQAVKLIFFIVLLNLLTFCSSDSNLSESKRITSSTNGYLDGLVAKVSAKWFETPRRFKLIDSKGEALSHFFWDINPEINYKEHTLQFIVTTPEDSKFDYKLNLSSGQLYIDHKYCEREDAWKMYKEAINKPPYTMGIIPRMLDQLMEPQKIIVFGDKDFYNANFQSNFFEARVIGSIVLQNCPNGACTNPGSWNSSLIVIAVQNKNVKYKDVKNIDDLKKLIDWDSVKAFLENSNGNNKLSKNIYPAYRVGSEVSLSQTMAFLVKNTKVFTIEDMKSLKLSCYKLYDYLWNNLRPTKNDTTFHKRFVKDFKKFHKEFHTCSKYVYTSSINDDIDRFKLFLYLDAVFKLNHMGYYFNCERKIWQPNILVKKNTRLVTSDELFSQCNSKDIDIAIESSVAYFSILDRTEKNSYRFIEYDNGSFGSHSKIYSWVKTNPRTFSCKSEEGFILKKSEFDRSLNWTKRAKHLKHKNSKLGEIIE